MMMRLNQFSHREAIEGVEIACSARSAVVFEEMAYVSLGLKGRTSRQMIQ